MEGSETSGTLQYSNMAGKPSNIPKLNGSCGIVHCYIWLLEVCRACLKSPEMAADAIETSFPWWILSAKWCPPSLWRSLGVNKTQSYGYGNPWVSLKNHPTNDRFSTNTCTNIYIYIYVCVTGCAFFLTSSGTGLVQVLHSDEVQSQWPWLAEGEEIEW